MKEIIMNTLPTAAGFAMFLPVPPNTILTITMANTAPIAASYHCTEGGSMSARMSPVTTDVKSNCIAQFLHTAPDFANVRI